MRKSMALLLALFSASAIAEYDTSQLSSYMRNDREIFVNSLPANLAKDDETTILRAYILQSVVCQIPSKAAKTFCADINSSEDLDGQNVQLMKFNLSNKNL